MNKKYINNPVTLGQLIRNKRIELGLNQPQVAKIFKVTTDTITYWELNRSSPQIKFNPKIISFLEYNPFELKSDTLSNRLLYIRLVHGYTHRKIAKLVEVDEGSISRCEKNTKNMSKSVLDKIEIFVIGKS